MASDDIEWEEANWHMPLRRPSLGGKADLVARVLGRRPQPAVGCAG